MTRSLTPPRGIEIPTAILYNMALSPAVRDTWSQLRGLAWGLSETPPLSIEQIMKHTGKSRSTVFGHMADLRDRGALQWRPAGTGTLIVSFDLSGFSGGIQNSGESKNPDSPDLLTTQTISSSKDKKIRRVQNSGQSENLDSTAKATTRQITDAYTALLGYDPGDWAAGEGKAAKWIGQNFSVEEFREAYRYFKSQKFWGDKRLTLRHLRTQIAEYFAAKGSGRLEADKGNFNNANNRTGRKTNAQSNSNGSGRTSALSRQLSTGNNPPAAGIDQTAALPGQPGETDGPAGVDEPFPGIQTEGPSTGTPGAGSDLGLGSEDSEW